MTTSAGPVPILTRSFVRLLVTVACSGISFYLLLSVVPLYLAGAGSGGAGAGLATGTMMLATVLTELAMPALLTRYGYRSVLALGLALLGAPALLLTVSSALPLVLAVCLARGAGLAIMVVAGTALVADLAPAGRRGEALGLYGVVAGVPAALGLPLGVYLSHRAGFEVVFVLAAGLSLAGLAAVPGLPGVTPRAHGAERRVRVLGGLRGSGLIRPTVVFGAVTLAGGVVVTFLPLAVTGGRLASVALLVQAATAPVARWLAGRYADRLGAGRLLVPTMVVTAVGLGALVRFDQPVVLLGGMVLFGLGFGAAQSVTLALMFERVPASRNGQVSALWNLAYDAGMGIGAVGFGVVVGATGYSWAFGLTAMVLVIALGPAFGDRRTIAPRPVDVDVC